MDKRKSGGIGYLVGKWPLEKDQSTLVFIHGSGCSAQFWQMQVAGLAEKVNTVALDLPGHGSSQGIGEGGSEPLLQAVRFVQELSARACSRFADAVFVFAEAGAEDRSQRAFSLLIEAQRPGDRVIGTG